MTQFSVGGSSAGVFTWSAVYDDAARSVTVQGDGAGHCTVVVQQSDGRDAAVQFVQPSVAGNAPVPLPPGVSVNVTRTVAIGGGPVVISPVTLKPFPSPKPGGIGGFMVTNEEWRLT